MLISYCLLDVKQFDQFRHSTFGGEFRGISLPCYAPLHFPGKMDF